MKRLIALLMSALLVLCSLGLTAAAETQTGKDAYIDATGKAVYVVNGAEAGVLPFDSVRKIVHITDDAIFLTARTMEGATALFAWSPLLSTNDSSILIAAVAGDPVYVAHDDAIYFLNAENPRQLMKCQPRLTAAASVVRLLPSNNCVLREAMDGLNVSQSINGETVYSRILDADTGMLRVTQFDPDADWVNFDTFETQYTAEGGLELRRQGETTWRFISFDNVTAQALMDGQLLYLMEDANGATWLARYDLNASAGQLSYLYRINGRLQPTLLAGDGIAYVIDTAGNIQACELDTGKYVGNWTANAQRAEMRLCADRLLVYETLNDAYALRLKTDLPWKTQAVYNRLAAGSRGDDVRALQERLNELGYSAGRADGIFGGNTTYAVVYFQDAVGMTQDGVATPELQQKLFSNGAPVYQEYVELSRGGRTGVRVRTLQERLRELGYQADAADGVYGARTQTAVSLFQSENGLRATGVATVETQRKLMSRGAAVCSSYILLRKGDSGVRVTELQERLRELGYLAGEANGDYDSATAEAVRLFCQTNGLGDTNQADEAVQLRLFSRSALPYDGYIELRRGDSGELVRKLQARLAELGYYTGELNGNFNSLTREAVRLFQQYNALVVDGVAGVKTQEQLYSRWAIPFDGGRVDPTPRPTDEGRGQPTPVPAPTPTPAPDEQNIDEYDLMTMVMWMNENHPGSAPAVGFGAAGDGVWEPVNFVSWLQLSLYLQEFLAPEDYVLRQDGIYDLATKEAVEAFQRFYAIGKGVRGYRYGVADGDTLQMLWTVTPDAYK